MTAPAPRIFSLDIMRGLVMLLMIFVNDLADVQDLPWWNYHLHANENGMTYVDMVFPLFLFILGMAIPLAIRSRLAGDGSLIHLWRHILARVAALLALGLALANASNLDPAHTGLSSDRWLLLVLLGAILFWKKYSGRSFVRWLGLLMIVAMFALFRRTTQTGQVAWFSTGYWEILGIIGWTYLSVCILYVPTRGRRWAPLIWLALAGLFNAFCAAGHLKGMQGLPHYNGAFVFTSMAGVVLSQIFFETEWPQAQKLRWSLLYAALLLVAGVALMPLGVSKIRATPTWCLFSAGAGTLLFALLYWICDVRGKTQWAAFAKPAGANTLLTYLLPDIYYSLIGSAFLPAQFHQGLPGAVKALGFTAFILAVSWLLTRWGVRLQL